jgi:hypothetical protein
MKKIYLALVFCLVSSFCFAQTAPYFDDIKPGHADITTASISSNLSVTGHTAGTTASYTVATTGSTTATQTTRLTNYGFSQLGDAATGIKMKVVTSAIPATVSTASEVAHNLTAAKIIGFTAYAHATNGDVGMMPGYTDGSGTWFYEAYTNQTSVGVKTGASSSAILELPVEFILWYVE